MSCSNNANINDKPSSELPISKQYNIDIFARHTNLINMTQIKNIFRYKKKTILARNILFFIYY